MHQKFSNIKIIQSVYEFSGIQLENNKRLSSDFFQTFKRKKRTNTIQTLPEKEKQYITFS